MGTLYLRAFVARTMLEEEKDAHLGELKVFKEEWIGLYKQLLDISFEDWKKLHSINSSTTWSYSLQTFKLFAVFIILIPKMLRCSMSLYLLYKLKYVTLLL